MDQSGIKVVSERRKVLIAVPTLTCRISAPLGLWITSLMLRSRSDSSLPLFAVHFEPSVIPVEYARNRLVGAFLRSDLDAILFVDDDMVPSSTAELMFQSKADMVAGRATGISDREGSPKLLITAFIGQDDEGQAMRPKDLRSAQFIDGAGTGCLLVSRKVLEDRRMWGPLTYTDIKGREKTLEGPDSPDFAPPIFMPQRKPNGQWIRGEDMDFTFRATALGYTLEWIPQALFGHYKQVDLLAVEEIMDRAYRGGVESFSEWVKAGNDSTPEAFYGQLLPKVIEKD